MPALPASIRELGLRDVGFGIASLLGFVGTIFAQLAWMILFDSTGLDTVTPVPVFMVLVPALTIGLGIGLLASRLYSRRTTLLATGAIVLASGLLAAFTIDFYRLCGPGC